MHNFEFHPLEAFLLGTNIFNLEGRDIGGHFLLALAFRVELKLQLYVKLSKQNRNIFFLEVFEKFHPSKTLNG